MSNVELSPIAAALQQRLLERDPAILDGAACFKGTQVPVATVMTYLQTGRTTEDFLRDFPAVSREQMRDLFELARRLLFTEEELHKP